MDDAKAPQKVKLQDNILNNKSERTVIRFAKFIYWAGIITGVICIFELGHKDGKFNPIVIISAFGIIFVSILISALLKVFVNISLTLKEINKDQKK